MKKNTIMHIALSSSVTEDMSYQENLLSDQNIKDGFNVIIVSNASKFENGKLKKTPEETIILNNGVILIRKKYKSYILDFLSKKIRKVKKLYDLIEYYKPDIIFSHSTCYYSIIDVIKYKKKYPNTHLVVDTHAASYNSGQNIISKYVLHKFLYRRLTKKVLPYIDAFYYIGYEEKKFAIENYKVPESKMSFLPLGGMVPSSEEYQQKREFIRKKHNISDENILFIHTGKLDHLKKSADLLHAFIKVKDTRFRLFIIGYIPDTEASLFELIKRDNRISFLGWKNKNELLDYLCASDVYCQPGSVSATMQNSICCNCAVMSYKHECYIPYNYGNFMWINDREDIEKCFKKISNNEINIKEMISKSKQCAKDLLDYKVIAQKIYNDCSIK